MPSKTPSPGEIIAKLQQADELLGQSIKGLEDQVPPPGVRSWRERPKDLLTDTTLWAAIITVVVPNGFVALIVSQAPSAVLVVAAATLAFVVSIMAVAALWRAGGHGRTASRVLLLATCCLFSGWAGGGLALYAASPTQVVLDQMKDASEWKAGVEWNTGGTAPYVDAASGRSGDAVQMSYTLAADTDWVSMAKGISSEALSGTRGVGFWYKGSGAPNTLELKLFYPKNANNQIPVFHLILNHATGATDWTRIEAPYASFTCWTETGCTANETVDPSRVAEIGIAVSDQSPMDQTGVGSIIVDQVYAYR
jgi:hypothetical protein